MKLFIFSFLFFLCCWKVSPAQNTVESVTKAMKASNASEVSKSFDKLVDITINNEQSTYSKSQAEMILKNFFSAHEVISFTEKHKGSPNDQNSVYLIGELNTKDNKKFRIYLYFKQKSGVLLLQEIRLEE